jgi:periplasmic protein CpxP/Spy
MKLKTLSILASALVLTVTAAPFAVQAQTTSPTTQPGINALNKVKRGKGFWQQLNLTPEQKTRIKEIQRNTRTQIEAVFTPEQKAKLQAAMQARREQRAQGQRPQGRRQGKKFAELNLTPEQKTRMQQIRQSTQQQIEAVLTAEQRQKLQEFKNNARSRRQPANR